MRRLIGRIQCWLGWHDWYYSRAPKDALTVGWTGYYRDCRRRGCRAHQFESQRHEWRE